MHSTEDPDPMAGGWTLDARATVVRDLKTGFVEDMNALWSRTMRDNPTPPGGDGAGIQRWENARFERPGARPVKVNSIEFKWKIRTGETQTYTIRRDPAAIVRDAIAGTLLFVDQNGQITGDVDKELGVDRGKPSS